MPDNKHIPYRKKRAITLQDIANHCSLSIATTSCALRGDRKNASEETIRRVHEAAQLLGYDPARNHAARQLALSKYGQQALNHIVALLYPPNFMEDSYHIHMYHGILDMLAPQRFALLTTYPFDQPDSYPIVFDHGEVDGIIVLGNLEQRPAFINILRSHAWLDEHPIITMLAPSTGNSSVLTDDRRGGYLAAAHLLDLGHRHLLHASFQSYPHQQRLLGMQDAYHERGLDPAAHLHHFNWHIADLPTSWVELDTMLQALPQVTGILAPNDLAAFHLRNYLQRRGCRVPDEMSIIGYDDTDPIFDEDGNNILTSVRLPLREVGRQAAQTLVTEILQPSSPRQTVVLPVELILRNTTAPAREGNLRLSTPVEATA